MCRAYEVPTTPLASSPTAKAEIWAQLCTRDASQLGSQPLIVLMHGDREVSTKQLARQAAKKTVQPCRPDVAERHTGYEVGGTSPFGTRKALPIYVEESILKLPRIFINGGRRGFLVGLTPQDLGRALAPTVVNVAISPGGADS
jgi:Cys-tRNA(Pro) deacylase